MAERDFIVIGRRFLKLFKPGDLEVAALLSQIAYWFSPKKDGTSKLRVQRHGKFWIAKTRDDWMNECCISRKQYLRAMKILKEQGIIDVRVMLFHAIAMNHVHLNENVLDALLRGECLETSQPVVPKRTSRSSPNAPAGCPLLEQPYKEHILPTEITSESTNIKTSVQTPNAEPEGADGDGNTSGGAGNEIETLGWNLDESGETNANGLPRGQWIKPVPLLQ